MTESAEVGRGVAGSIEVRGREGVWQEVLRSEVGRGCGRSSMNRELVSYLQRSI